MKIFTTLFFCCMLVLGAAAQTATISVDAAVDKGLLFRAEAYNNLSGVNTGAATRNADYTFMNSQGLHAKVQRMWISESLYNPSTGVYNWTNYDPYLSSVSNLLADTILINIQGNTMVDSWGYTPAQCKPILKNIIKYIKTNYPKLVYVEGLNEPDLYTGTTMTPSLVYSYYKAFSDAVNEVNAELNPAVPLKVGGPAISSFKFAGATWIQQFLQDYKNDTDPNKRLDFISYHTYSYKENPRETESVRTTLESWLTTIGLPTTLPSMVTETGLFPGPATSGAEADDALRQAAGMASYVYWETNNTNSVRNVPFNWVMRHAAEVRKDQLVTRPVSYSDRFTPYGNMMKMMGMMKTERIGATTNVMDANGLGIYGLASSDATGISVMVWNYQHTGTSDYATNVNISNLPAVFTGMGIRKKVYRIDQRTSNNYYNVNNCNLQLVSDTIVANPGTAYNVALGVVNENSLQLVVLEPVPAPAANNFELAVSRTGNSLQLKWNTATENNSYYFEVLRSADGNSFSKIANVNAAGNSSSTITYNYIDATPLAGINYYQVKLVHTDSSRMASGVVNAFISLALNTTDIYYNFGTASPYNGAVTSGVPTGWAASNFVRANASGVDYYTATSPSNGGTTVYTGASGGGNVNMSAVQGSLNGRTVTYSGTTTNIPATSISSLSYYELTITPVANEPVKIRSISFGSRSIGSSGGPANVVIRTSMDNYAANVYNQDINTGAVWTLYTANFPYALSGALGTPVTIRIYANDAVGGSTSSTNNWRVDDVNINVELPAALPQINTVTANEIANRAVQVSWQTAYEQNVTNFQVLRSQDGNVYSSIGTVAATGNATTPSSYSFTDANSFTGISYYKIKMNGPGATLVYSDSVSIYLAQGAVNNIYYSFGATGAETGTPTSGIPNGWTVTALSRGNSNNTNAVFSSTSPSNTYNGASAEGNATMGCKQASLTGRTVNYNGTPTAIPQTAISGLTYFEFTITPAADQVAGIVSMSFGSRSIGSSGGPNNVVIRTSLDNYTSNVFTQDINGNAAWQLVSASFTNLGGSAGQAIKVRIYANDAVGGTANNWRIDDLNIGVTSNSMQILPVRITQFAGSLQPNGVQLVWKTASEQNSSHYEIERSENGWNFKKVGAVTANRNSSVNSYHYLDTKPVVGNSYYRLKQVDVDGKFQMYGPLLIKNQSKAATLQVFPKSNSVDIVLTADKAESTAISLLDMNGHLLASKFVSVIKGANYVHLPVALSNGAYNIHVAGISFQSTQKFVK